MIVTRFAPSPTGYLHVGGARTALYSWAYARRHGGKFILRIEDTDQERSDPKMAEAILDSMRWLGLDWDEGPFYQSERRAIYDEHLAKMVETGHAYECYCTPEELEARRAALPKEDQSSWHYDGQCRRLGDAERSALRAAGRRPVLRLRLPDDAHTVVHDALRGHVNFEASVLDDLVIRKSDGFPTFHFAVALDDALMGVTDVIRGDDHLSNTPKQIQILAALHASTGDERFHPPRYAHLPLILGADGKRFSKRHGATAVGEYRTRGFLPEALVNFLALLGWSPGEDRELITVEEMTKCFDLERVNRSGAVFDEVKLQWMNGKYLETADAARIADLLTPDLAPFALTDARLVAWGCPIPVRDWIVGVTNLAKSRVRLIPECVNMVRFFLEDDIVMDPVAETEYLVGTAEHPVAAGLSARLQVAADAIRAATPWTLEAVEAELRARPKAAGMKLPMVYKPLRVVLTGRAQSPGIFETVYYTGRERCLRRIEAVIGAAL